MTDYQPKLMRFDGQVGEDGGPVQKYEEAERNSALFLEKRNLDLYKEVFIQERDKVKKMIKDTQDQLLQQEVPDYSEFE